MASSNSSHVLNTYVAITCLSTFANAFIWGINTLFLLDAGLTITQAFAANAFFTLGLVIFEVPTGVVADGIGRRASYLLGCCTLLVGTLGYWVLWKEHGAFWLWACASVFLGLGFTFFSGATEAWLVDALAYTKFEGTLDSAFGRGQVASGITMFAGSAAGGLVAQVTNLGIPYLVRAGALAVSFLVTLLLMRDLGFTPRTGRGVMPAVRALLQESLEHGFRKPPVRWVMLAGPFTMGVGMYAFYALQPYLLQLYGKSDSYAIAGAAAALVSATQILGGLSVPLVRRLFARRTNLLAVGLTLSAATMLLMGLLPRFWFVLAMVALWATFFAATGPVRQAYLNGIIPSAERATVLSFDSLITSLGGAGFQPALGSAAARWGYPASYVLAGAVNLIALPFLLLARKEDAPSDRIRQAAKS